MRAIVNTELMLKLNLKLSKLLVKSQQNEKLSDDEIKDAGIIVSKLTQDKITLEEEINAISIGYKNLLDWV